MQECLYKCKCMPCMALHICYGDHLLENLEMSENWPFCQGIVSGKSGKILSGKTVFLKNKICIHQC